MNQPVAVFVSKGERLAVDGVACTVSAVYTDGSAFITRDDLQRVSVVRSKGNSWTLGGRPVEVRQLPRKSFDELIEEARAALRARGIYMRGRV